MNHPILVATTLYYLIDDREDVMAKSCYHCLWEYQRFSYPQILRAEMPSKVAVVASGKHHVRTEGKL